MIATASEIKNNFGFYLKNVIDENGQVIITKNNNKVAKLVPYISEMEKYYTINESAIGYDYRKNNVTFQEFMEISEKSNARLEFIDGEIIVMSSPTYEHQRILGELHISFMSYFKGKKCKPFFSPFDIIFRKNEIKEPDVMQPDLFVICDIENRNEKDKYMGIPTLTLEIISPSTRSIDLLRKLNTYMLSGVKEYWIVDVDGKKISIFTFTDFQIDKIEHYKNNETAASFVFEGLSVNLPELFEEV